MPLQFTSLASIDIQRIIFEQILKVQPTGNFQADFLNLIFFPHIVIVIWLFFIAKSGTFLNLHRGIGFLLSTAIYVFIIYNGWYAAIASLSVFWLTLTIFISIFYFIFPVIVHPSVTKQRFQIGESIKGAVIEKRNLAKAIEALDEDIKYLHKEVDDYKKSLRDSSLSDEVKGKIQEGINQKEAQIRAFETERRKLENMKWF